MGELIALNPKININTSIHVCFLVLLFLIPIFTYAQTTKQDSYKTISTKCIFDSKKITIGNYEIEEVYKINSYYISVTDISQKQADSLNGKKVLVTGKLIVFKACTRYKRTGNKGQLIHKYKEPKRKFIIEPTFSVISNTKKPLKKE
jgi:hypothetical protein